MSDKGIPLMPWMYHEQRPCDNYEEFCARFKAYMLKAGETFDDGSSIAEYADDVAPSYWEDEDMRVDGPEACAAADMDYWGEE